MLRGLKSTIVWKPIFVAVGFALIVMAIRAAVNLIAASALPPMYYPFDLWTGLGFTPYGVLTYPAQAVGILAIEAQNAYAAIQTASATFNAISLAVFAVAYFWLGALTTIASGEPQT